jgi:hypothetical protein
MPFAFPSESAFAFVGILSKCHKFATKGDFEGIVELQDKLDDTVIELWGIPASELALVKQALGDLEPVQAEEMMEEVSEAID